ncbi:alpha/beta hydrolase [Leptolyngbya sp. FACHB-711]|uniref:alpha/beta fold hydrolase n=1 Tax=unclassified Leptolyngbya TaxID=2650499 RepID=UPI001687EF37|nr:alpha/beta hydrolase [Leptolyngbya sp. FACHB-711]MBD1849449.1 alpha/beta hydrolase [Cyanobacteria bacterium FACHB-502]MBD2027835.1 alpha/beta hydrolase [Leptolyngbya sp. FACHB-711]
MKDQLRGHSIQLGQGKLFYRAAGNLNQQTPIFFLHGWGISTEPYQEVLSLFARSHALVAPDLPSFDQSSDPRLFTSYQSFADRLIELLDLLKLESVHLVGHSLGGGISIWLAAHYPDRVKSLSLIDSTGVPSGSVPEVLLRRSIEMPLQLSLPKLKLQFVDIPQVFANNLLMNLPNVISALLISLMEDITPLLPRIQAPSLILWSKKDLTTLLPCAETMTKMIPDSRQVLVEEGYHEWGLLYPEKMTTIVLNFIHEIEACAAVGSVK